MKALVLTAGIFSILIWGEANAQNASGPDTTKKQPAPASLFWEKLTLSGDFRFRGEQDWDSKKTDGTERADRGRLRYRLRFGFENKWNQHISFGGRLRSGDSKDQQSPHITLGREMEPTTINIDKAYLKGSYNKAWWWMGKNNLPFWTQNELWWDDDVTPEGISLGGKLAINNKTVVKPIVGYFIVNDLGKGLEMNPTMAGGQLVLESNSDKYGITVASGYYLLNDIPNQNDGTGTYTVNYALLNSGIKFTYKLKNPLSVGFDYLMNLEDYDNDTLIAPVFRDQKSGYVGSVNYGKLATKGDFLVGYYYAYIPKFSVVDYFSQDDWVRWNYTGATGTRSSNFTGHEIRLAYCMGKNFNIVARTYLVEGIVTTGKALETNNRFRLDFDIKF